MSNNILPSQNNIQSKIHTIRNQQVLLDSDLAILYRVETKAFNQAVKRNINRFPERFRFQLTDDEYEKVLRSQNVTFKESLNEDRRGQHRKYLPYVFTEQGVSMLSAILRSDIAVEVSIQIIDTFVEMKRYLASNDLLLQRFERIENRLGSHDDNFKQIFEALEDKNKIPEQLVFFNGTYFDAHSFIIDLIKSAKKSITLIDNYIDNTTLTMLSNNQEIDISLISHTFSKQLKQDIEKYNKQYKPVTTSTSKTYHDRYLIIDSEKVYCIGASLKDVGHKTFSVNLMSDFCENNILKIL